VHSQNVLIGTSIRQVGNRGYIYPKTVAHSRLDEVWKAREVGRALNIEFCQIKFWLLYVLHTRVHLESTAQSKKIKARGIILRVKHDLPYPPGITLL
jgi:hypothetical protein